MSQRKITTLTLREKMEVINAVRSGMKKRDVAALFKLPVSTMYTIVKKQDEILSRCQSSANLSCKRHRTAVFPDLEECLIAWFRQCCNENINVSGPMLRKKAEEFSKSMGHGSFQASNGWFLNFKKRHGLVFSRFHGLSASVKNEFCDEWKNELQSLLNNYEPEDVFNAAETGLFFKCLPDETLIFKNKTCHDGKHSKERLTILLATNITGTEKLKPLVIGNCKKPHGLSTCKSLPLDYKANKKAWMTAEIFRDWLIQVDNKMIQENRRILLFIENCTAHNLIPPMNAVDVKFLPSDKTHYLQPLDHGIIKNFKTCYRKEIVMKIISDMEQQSASPINVIHAIRMVDKAWRNVSETTISNCFKICGFSLVHEGLDVVLEPDIDLEADWSVLQNVKVKFEDYVKCDEGIATTGILSDTEELNTVNQSDDSEDLEPTVSNEEAREAINKLRIYVERCCDAEDHVFDSLFNIENVIDKQFASSVKEEKITDFFDKSVTEQK